MREEFCFLSFESVCFLASAFSDRSSRPCASFLAALVCEGTGSLASARWTLQPVGARRWTCRITLPGRVVGYNSVAVACQSHHCPCHVYNTHCCAHGLAFTVNKEGR
jgi:hypothetical protein